MPTFASKQYKHSPSGLYLTPLYSQAMPPWDTFISSSEWATRVIKMTIGCIITFVYTHYYSNNCRNKSTKRLKRKPWMGFVMKVIEGNLQLLTVRWAEKVREHVTKRRAALFRHSFPQQFLQLSYNLKIERSNVWNWQVKDGLKSRDLTKRSVISNILKRFFIDAKDFRNIICSLIPCL